MNTTTATEPVAEQVDLSDSGIKQFVTFELQDEHFAFPMAEPKWA